jgi:hypothetical protein
MTPPYESITNEEGKVFYLVPELLTLMDKASVQLVVNATWNSGGYPAGCSACHFNRKERRQPQHPSRDHHEHCNCPMGGVINDYKCASTRNIFVTPRNLKRYQIRAVTARLTGELK